MLTYDDALTLAKAWVAVCIGEGIQITCVEKRPYGWIFHYQSSEFLASGDGSFAIIGNGPIIVDRINGDIITLDTGTGFEIGLAAYEASIPSARLEMSLPEEPREESPEKLFDGTISTVAELGTMTVGLRLPKANRITPLVSVHLHRPAVIGLDLHVPVAFRDVGDSYEIFLILPIEYSGTAFLTCTHAPDTPNPSASVTSGDASGPTYDILLKPTLPWLVR